MANKTDIMESIYVALPKAEFKAYNVIKDVLDVISTDSDRKKKQEMLEGKFRLMKKLGWIDSVDGTDSFIKRPKPETDNKDFIAVANKLSETD